MRSKNTNCDCGCGGVLECAYLTKPKCDQCSDETDNEPKNGVRLCFTCQELENNRRYRLHNNLGEYAS